MLCLFHRELDSQVIIQLIDNIILVELSFGLMPRFAGGPEPR
jgi:hypothetical protein